MQQRERRGREQVTFLRASCRILNERRRVPLGEENGISFGLEPLVEQGELGGLAAAVGAFDDEEFAGELVLSVGDHRRPRLGYSCYRDVKRHRILRGFMKTLYLLRHAKSSWKDDSLRDFDRPLKGRGRDAAEEMGKVVGGEKLNSLLVISSPAARARETTGIVLQSAGLKLEPRFDERIYEADVRTLLEVIASIPDETTTAMLVGHNPGFENLLAYLTGDVRHMPTCALAKIELNSWSDVSESSGTLESFVTPKEQ